MNSQVLLAKITIILSLFISITVSSTQLVFSQNRTQIVKDEEKSVEVSKDDRNPTNLAKIKFSDSTNVHQGLRRWLTVKTNDSPTPSYMVGGSAKISVDPGSSWLKGAKFSNDTWVSGEVYGGRPDITFRGIQNARNNLGMTKRTHKDYLPTFEGRAELKGTGMGPAVSYRWDVEAIYTIRLREIKVLAWVASAKTGFFVNNGDYKQTGPIITPTNMIAQETVNEIIQWSTERLQEYVEDELRDFLKKFTGIPFTSIDEFIEFIENIAETVGVNTQQINLLKKYFDLVAGVTATVESFSITETQGKVFIEYIEFNDGTEIKKTTTLDLTFTGVDTSETTDIAIVGAEEDAGLEQIIKAMGRGGRNWQQKVKSKLEAAIDSAIKQWNGDQFFIIIGEIPNK
jgi:hypothetical protein